MSRSLSSTFSKLASSASATPLRPSTSIRCLFSARPSATLAPKAASSLIPAHRSYASSARLASTTSTIPIAKAPSGPSSSSPKPKHKPTRKATIEAAPIRAQTSSTRSYVRHIYSFSTSTSYSLPLLSPSLPPSARLIPLNPSGSETCYWVPLGSKSQAISGEGPKDEKTGLVDSHDLGSEENGEIWILENGSFVSWGLEREKALEWWAGLKKPDGFELGKYDATEEESLDFFFDPAEPSTRLQGDIIILAPASNAHALRQADALPTPSSLLTRFAFSEALSRSSQLSVLEAQLNGLIERSEAVPSYLAKHGKGPYKRKEVIQKLGEFLVVRQAVNLQGVGDTPELYWDEPVLEQYFTGLVRALEVRQRVHDLNSKISHAQEVHTILKDLLTEKSGHHMELIIIVIIAVEATIAVWGHWEELMRSIGLVSREPKEV